MAGYAGGAPSTREREPLRERREVAAAAGVAGGLHAIAADILGYELTGKKAKFLNFRHTGASHIAQRGRDPRHLLAFVKMMGDTSVATVNHHYFNLEDDQMQEIIDGWAVPDVDVFTPDLAPVCAAETPENRRSPPPAPARIRIWWRGGEVRPATLPARRRGRV